MKDFKAMSEVVISLQHIKKKFGRNVILKDISFDLYKGENIVLCGSSGSGKSTILRCINGLESYNRGKILIDGMLVTQNPMTLNKVRCKVGMVFQSLNLFPHLTVLENCSLAPILVSKLSREEAEQKALAILKKVYMDHKSDSYPSYLSGGEQQRVAIARTLSMDVDVVLYDEVTASLDPVMSHEVLDIMKELSKIGVSSICVTHDMDFVKNFADKVCLINDGNLIVNLTPEEFFDASSPIEVRRFLRS